MKILLLCDIDTSGKGNPFGLQLLMSLECITETDTIQHGTCWLYKSNLDYNVIHIHWPEALVHWDDPTSEHLEYVKKKLMGWKKHAVIVATVHNEYPHNFRTKKYIEIFKIVYECADGLIHFGNSSENVIKERYISDSTSSVNEIIPHGDYSWFPNEVSQAHAREYLRINNHDAVMLSFGEIRSMDELNLIIDSFKQLDKKNKKLYVAGRLPNPLNSIKGNLNYILTRMPFYLDKSMFNYEKFVDPADVQYYLNASDILFISKIKALNSGNVSLGFTFGKVVVGPDVGVIGEILKETGNPVYNPHKLNTIVKAIEKGFNLAAQGHGENNNEYAKKNMQWNMIANKHINFYKDLLKMKMNSN